ncbi:sugar transferase [Mesorhizobium sp. 10J20-29]
MKRFLDVVIALPLLALMSPLMLLAALWIRLTSAGPAVFSQLRVGKDQAPFRCHKLRTMYADTASRPTHEVAVNAVTPFGRLLRRCKFDELPQLWNVIEGSMSLVGPRPCLPMQHELIAQRQRLGVFSLRPGITGLAQVRGIDMSTPAALAEADAEYLAKQSLWLDLGILFRTLIRF